MSISQKAAFDIIHKSTEIKDGPETRTLRLALASKTDRLNLIREDPKSEDAKAAAAIEIQRHYRSMASRTKLLGILQDTTSKVAQYGESKADVDRLKDVPTPEEKHIARQKLEEAYNNLVNELMASGVAPTSDEIPSFNDFCSDYIKRWWKKSRTTDGSTLETQSTKTNLTTPLRRPPKKQQREGPLDQNDAATIIQKAWRRHIDVQVYRYYRDLINFKSRGDPTMMLRCINPQEAKLLDAAAGIHIKFRLAGERFPPNIYYKIFTHRPIQDLCANSPKDYTSADTKRKLARDVHNKGNRVPEPSKAGWYQRSENNGYRLVSDRLIQHVLSDPVTWETSRKKIEFHHNRLQRKEDLERKKKRKKIDWMRKMYHEGMLRAKVDDEETVGLIEGAAAGMVATIERHGMEAVQDWEVDELLDWTTSLNFEEYIDGWKEIATSANSEKPVCERMDLTTAAGDPYEFTLSAPLSAPQREGSTRQSHNTPNSSRAGSIA